LQEVLSKTFSFFVWGRIDYVDAFGQDRHFIFKASMNGGAETLMVDGIKAEGWGLKPIENGFDSN